MTFKLDEYVDVAARITQFYERYPNGRLTRRDEPRVLEVGTKLFICYTALAYRTPDDPIPAIGTAWEPFPGPTQFTRDSELMNAETAAWGRAIIAVGIGSKKIASREEVRARTDAPASAQTGPPIGKDRARYLLEEAGAAAVKRDRLQLAASHIAGRDVGSCESDTDAPKALGSLDADQASKLSAWIAGKAKPKEARP